jgi:hypothetical protein
MELTGWDSLGPIGQYPSVWATQGGGPGLDLGAFVRIDPTTLKVRSTFSDSSTCLVWNSVASGDFVCTQNPVPDPSDESGFLYQQPVSVRRASGRQSWHFSVTGPNGAYGPLLAPDSQHALICCDTNDAGDVHEWLVGHDGSQVTLAGGFYAEGWLDSRTLIADSAAGLAFFQVADPTRSTSIAVAGAFLGTVWN